MKLDHQNMLHPNVHTAFQDWSEEQTLHVAVAYSNPFRWRTRRELLNDFRYHMRQSPNVILHVGELAYGDRPFEVTSSDNPLDVQMRTSHELFHKENILNEVIRRFPSGWKYGAYIDGDFTMTRHDWALEAVHQLQHHDWVQLFSSYADVSGRTLSDGMRPLRLNNGFAFNYWQNGCQLPTGFKDGGWKGPADPDDQDDKDGVSLHYPHPHHPHHHHPHHHRDWIPVGATGGAWAFRRPAFDTVGGLLDVCILGHGDWFMTFGLVSEQAPDVGMPSYTDGYRRVIAEWQRNAAKLKKNIGYVDNFAIHHFHGSKYRRFYGQRYQILIDNKFDPLSDIKKDWQGIYQLTDDKPTLRDAIRRYFITRSEDDPTIKGDAGERSLI